MPLAVETKFLSHIEFFVDIPLTSDLILKI